MPVGIRNLTPSAYYFGNSQASRLYIGDVRVWPAFAPVSQTFATAGAWTFNIPTECLLIDVILLGAGGGGSSGNGAIGTGEGGDAGEWLAVTLRRGVDIPWNVLQITGTVGNGGSGGPGGWLPLSGDPGQPTVATIAGVGSIQANGGTPGAFATGRSRPGKGPGPYTYNGIQYPGGANTANSAANGNAPGGGGGGGNSGFFGLPAGAGGVGARGQAWARAYV
ncbi:hypothetical protein SEA_TINYBOT_4 [Mycobacterium phage Tinybot]|nr:hypothetical protein SEA_TINYBOT_4 [Mycobacterium phage Tinybot]